MLRVTNPRKLELFLTKSPLSLPADWLLTNISFSNRWGIFRLTNPPGLPHVLACDHNDTFHQHSIDNLYVEIGQQPPTHVYESSALNFTVDDLRQNH